MYVTDVPVVDRITDPTASAVEAGLYALETALADLGGWIEEQARSEFTSEEIHAGLDESLNDAYWAHKDVSAALPPTFYTI